MIRYLARRLISGLVTLFLFVSLVFVGTQVVLPGDFVSQYALFLSTSESEEMRQTLGLDLPLGERYLHWLSLLLHGDLGRSFSIAGMGAPVTEVILQSLPATLLVYLFVLKLNLLPANTTRGMRRLRRRRRLPTLVQLALIGSLWVGAWLVYDIVPYALEILRAARRGLL